jgi:hypothetical protein
VVRNVVPENSVWGVPAKKIDAFLEAL